MTTTTDKTSDELERDVERTRDRMSGTLDELRARMSPGQILDELYNVARDTGGGEMIQNLGRTVRDNPAPLLLVGAGVVWLVASSAASRGGKPAIAHDALRRNQDTASRPGSQSSAGNGGYPSEPGRIAADLASSSSSRSAASSFGGVSQAAGMAKNAAAEVHERVSSFSSAVADASTNLGEAMGATTDGARQSMHETRDAAYRGARDVTRAMSNLVHDQPLILGALGLALGATLGALIPRTDAENRLMGETRDTLKEQAGDFVSDQYEKAKSVAEKTMETVKETAAEQGLAADQPKGGSGGLGARAKTIFDDAKETARTEADHQGLTLDEAKKQAEKTVPGEKAEPIGAHGKTRDTDNFSGRTRGARS